MAVGLFRINRLSRDDIMLAFFLSILVRQKH